MILVTGTTGFVGSAVVRHLRDEGVADVIACARDRSKAEKLLRGGMIREANYDDPDALVEAFKDVRQLLFVPSDGFALDVLRHGRNVVEAARQSGVERFVFLSIVDVAGDSPFYYAPVYRDVEARLLASGMNWTILRCGLYADFVRDSWLRGARVSGQFSVPAGTAQVSLVSRQDVAMAGASVLKSDDRYAQKIFCVTGSESLTFKAIARLASEACRTPISYKPAAPADYLVDLWATSEDPWPHAFSTLFASIVQGRFAAVSEDFELLTGKHPETFAQFLERDPIG